jgi:hypothetical protein
MTDEPGREPLPAPDPDDGGGPHPWAGDDRPRGLDAYFAPGGEDEAPPERIADERRLLRLLVLMVALAVGIPTILTIIAFVGQLLSLRGG